MKRAPKLLVKPLRWTRAQWVLVKRRARTLGHENPADYIRELVRNDLALAVAVGKCSLGEDVEIPGLTPGTPATFKRVLKVIARGVQRAPAEKNNRTERREDDT